jgi:colicin import membrane protein
MIRFFAASFCFSSRRLQAVALGCVMCLASPASRAAPAEPVFDPVVLEARDQEAKALKEEGKAIRAEADRQLEIDTWNCYSKILVNYCIDKAKDRRYEAREKARTLEAQAAIIDREVRERRLVNQLADPPAELRQPNPPSGSIKKAIDEGKTIKQVEQERKIRDAEQSATPLKTDAEIQAASAERDRKAAEKRAKREAAEQQRAAEKAAYEAQQAIKNQKP